MSKHILIVEDEPALAFLLRDYLLEAGFLVSLLHDGADLMPLLSKSHVDLLLLDIMLPNRDGISLCREIRQQRNALPIIMTTAKVEEIDRLLALELGADDYICKPYSPREVVARVKAVLRRTQSAASEQAQQPLFSIDDEALSICIGDHKLDLTLVEYQLLTVLMEKPNKIFSRQQLMNMIYKDYRIVSDRTIDSHIKKLRKKIQKAPSLQSAELIYSVYGAGYKFEYPQV